eukprot:COSAG05_NODE_32_length_28165_cov_450.666714_28_plen_123_part_00
MPKSEAYHIRKNPHLGGVLHISGDEQCCEENIATVHAPAPTRTVTMMTLCTSKPAGEQELRRRRRRRRRITMIRTRIRTTKQVMRATTDLAPVAAMAIAISRDDPAPDEAVRMEIESNILQV